MAETKKKIKSIKFRKWKKVCLLNFYDGSAEELSMDLVVEYGLKKDMELDNDLFNKLINRQRKINLKQSAYNFAAYKPRTISQIKQKLRTLNYSEEEITTAVDFLKDFNLVNDAKFAENFVKDYIKRKPSGKSRVKTELYKRGVHLEIIEKVLKKSYPEGSIMKFANLAAEKKLRAIQHKPSDKQRSSLISYLQRQGFEWDTIKIVIENILKQD